MGMDNFNITLLYDKVTILQEGQCWKLKGFSEYDIGRIYDYMNVMCNKEKNNNWTYDNCINIYLYDFAGFFQGFELVGCLSYLEGGVEDCYEFYELWKSKIPLKIYILNQAVEVKNSKELYKIVEEKYQEKMEIFKKRYGNIEIKATSTDFQKQMKKRKNWLYKFLHHGIL